MTEQNNAKNACSGSACCSSGACGASECKPKLCCCRSAGGWLVILLGVVLLLRALGILVFHFMDAFWPLIIVFVGASMLMKGHCRNCPEK